MQAYTAGIDVENMLDDIVDLRAGAALKGYEISTRDARKAYLQSKLQRKGHPEDAKTYVGPSISILAKELDWEVQAADGEAGPQLVRPSR